MAERMVRGAGAGNHARSVALLGALVAIDATLRLVPSFLGAWPFGGGGGGNVAEPGSVTVDGASSPVTGLSACGPAVPVDVRLRDPE